MPIPDFPPTIPILGKAFEIVTHYPTVVIQCQCDSGDIMVLIGAADMKRCRGCGNTYAVGKIGKTEVGLVRDPRTVGVQ